MTLQGTFRSLATGSAMALLGALAIPGTAFGIDEEAQLKLGEMEYLGQCAACHGPKGKGDGPVAEVLRQKPSDLTMIAKDFNGTFPSDHIYKVVDGRNMINPHGDRQMPVWGHRYRTRAHARAEEVPHDVDEEAMVYGRIMALVQYLESIQTE